MDVRRGEKKEGGRGQTKVCGIDRPIESWCQKRGLNYHKSKKKKRKLLLPTFIGPREERELKKTGEGKKNSLVKGARIIRRLPQNGGGGHGGGGWHKKEKHLEG